MKWTGLCVALLLLLPGISCGGTVRTKAGQQTAGYLTLQNGSVLVHARQGEDVRFKLNEIAAIDFAQEPASPVTDAPGLGGLKAEYFVGTTFDPAIRKILRLDPGINFTWKYLLDAPFMPNDWTWVPFCVRWTGQIRPLYSENYTLRIREPLPDGGEIYGRLWIDDHLVIDDGFDSGQIELQAGHLYALRFDLVASRFDKHGKAALTRLMWESQTQRREIVPASCLYISPKAGDLPAVTRISSPMNQTEVFDRNVVIEAQAEPETRVVSRVELQANKALLNVFGAAPYQYTWKNAPLGDYELVLIASTKDGRKWPSGLVRLVVADDDGGKIPRPWARFNIGGAEQEPATIANRKITLARAGGELYATADRFQFAYELLTGDGEITAKLSAVSVDAPNAQPLAGLLIRRTLGEDSPECGVLFQPGVGTIFLNRLIKGNASINSPSATAVPGYLRLVRDGPIIRAYRSDDGTTWQFVDQTEIDLPATCLIGVALSAQSSGNASASFDGVTVISRGLHNYCENGPGLLLVDGTQLIGKIAAVDKQSVTLERGEQNARQRITVDLKTIARINFHRPDTPVTDVPDSTWRGVILSHGDLYEGDVNILGPHEMRVTSDVFGPRNFNVEHELSSAVLGAVQPAAAPCELVLTDGSILHPQSAEFVEGGMILHTVFAAAFHVDRRQLAHFRAP